MAEIGYFLSSEENGPKALVEQAQLVERHGFDSVWISDHYHPWLDDQGESPFVWSVIGGIAATTSLRVTTAVTCPIVRIHPAVVAQAAATSAVLLDGRFRLGVGTGENLNEHILGLPWPPTEIRLEMLEEAVEVMRQLWTGDAVTFRGTHYSVDNARLYSCPPEPVPVPVSAFGPKATEAIAAFADGFVSTSPDKENLSKYRELGGEGPSMAGVKVCYGPDAQEAAKLAHTLWRSSLVPGELSQELPMPAHFDQAAELTSPEMAAEKYACGPDPDRHAEVIKAYLDAGFDEVYVSQMGDDVEGFVKFFRDEVEPRL